MIKSGTDTKSKEHRFMGLMDIVIDFILTDIRLA